MTDPKSGAMDPIAVYAELLEADRSRWLAGADEFRQQLKDGGCQYGGRDLLKVLRPKFLSSGQLAYLSYVSTVLMGVFRRLSHMVMRDAELREFLNLSPDEMRLIEPEPLCPDPCAFVRLDAFQTKKGFRFVELNAEAPAGVGFSDATLRVFREHPLPKAAAERLGATPLETGPGLLEGLLAVWRASGGTSRPRILITDYLDVLTAPEFYLIRDYLVSCGLDTVVEDVRNLTYQHGRLIAQGAPVDLVYRRVITNEFLEREDEVRPLFEAYRDQAVVMVDPFRAKLVHKKSAFALLTGELLDSAWLTQEERLIIERHLPWTRRLKEGRADFHGKEIDLASYVRDHREDFVVKPSDDYGGRGVCVGWAVSDAEFASVIDRALREDWIVQERIETVEEPFPVIAQGLEYQPMVVDLDPYLYMGKMQGVLARLAAGALCNVTSGGGQVPVYIYPEP